jgi:hypothetical protein
MSFRATPELKERIEREAAESGRSISQEIEMRLAQTFRDSSALDQAMNMAYGPRLSVLLAVIAKGLTELQRFVKFPADWMDDPRLFTWAMTEVSEAMSAFAPPPDPEKKVNPDIGLAIVRSLLWAIKDPQSGADTLKPWAQPLHERLGEFADRLLVKEAGVLTKIAGQEVWLEGWSR